MNAILRACLLFALCAFAPLAHAADAPPAKLKYGTWGFDLSGMDSRTKPGDDFFRYANGTWLDKTQIPTDKSAYSMRIIMTEVPPSTRREVSYARFFRQPRSNVSNPPLRITFSMRTNQLDPYGSLTSSRGMKTFSRGRV